MTLYRFSIFFIGLCAFLLLSPVSFPSADDEPTTYTIGTWNVARLSLSKRGKKIIPDVANVIANKLNAKIMILNEVSGDKVEGEPVRESKTIMKLIEELDNYGGDYGYIITASGGSGLRVAILFDKNCVELNAEDELDIPEEKVQNQDIFSRNPLVARFTFLKDSVRMNDLLVVGLHLASGQRLIKNHTAAMDELLGQLSDLRAEGKICPDDEYDILVAGDFNSDFIAEKQRVILDEWFKEDYDVLATDNYPCTNLNGKELRPYSRLDYMIVSSFNSEHNGLYGEEIDVPEATVWYSLAGENEDWVSYKENFSDHFPVTVKVKVMDDTDQRS